MKVLSLYCGAGGIDEGLKQAGIKTTLAIDMWSDAIETIKLNHECETIVGKVGDYVESFNDFDIIVGGPPCPEFSRANSKRSFDMCEVNNFWSVVERCNPKYYLMENVQDVKKKLYKSNYLINTADYGVPQIRLRRFFTNLPWAEPTHSQKPQSTLSGSLLNKWISVKEALNLQDGILEQGSKMFGENEYRRYSLDRPSPTLLTDANFYLVDKKFPGRNTHELIESIHEPSTTIVVNNDLQLTNYKIFSTKYLEEKNPVMFKKHPDDSMDVSCCTITAKDRSSGSEMITDGQYARKLTNDELALLQGFPKDYKFFGGKTSVRRQIGNAVPPAPIREFFKQI